MVFEFEALLDPELENITIYKNSLSVSSFHFFFVLDPTFDKVATLIRKTEDFFEVAYVLLYRGNKVISKHMLWIGSDGLAKFSD